MSSIYGIGYPTLRPPTNAPVREPGDGRAPGVRP